MLLMLFDWWCPGLLPLLPVIFCVDVEDVWFWFERNPKL
jgi:hypothetical protein